MLGRVQTCCHVQRAWRRTTPGRRGQPLPGWREDPRLAARRPSASPRFEVLQRLQGGEEPQPAAS